MMPRHVYFAQEPGGLVKIGASRDPCRRVKEIVKESGRGITLLGVLPRGGITGERETHQRFASARVPDTDLPTSEWFRPTAPLMSFIEAEAEEYEPPKTRPIRTWLERFIDIGHEPYVGPEEAAEFLECSVETVRRKAKADQLPHIRPGRKTYLLRFRITELAPYSPRRKARGEWTPEVA